MKVLISTSLRPTPRIRTFCKDLTSTSLIFQYIARGKMNIPALFGRAFAFSASKIWLVFSKHGNPSAISFYVLEDLNFKKIGEIFIKGVSLKRELKNISSKSRKNKYIFVSPPEYEELHGLYLLIKNALPEIIDKDEPFTELKIIKDKSIILNFIDSETNLLCGPKIILRGYSSEKEVMYFEERKTSNIININNRN